MSDWLFVLLLVIVLAVVALVAVRLLRRRAQPPPPEQAPAADPFSTADVDSVRGDPRALAPGSIVEIRAQDYAVRGSLRMSEGSWTWQEHMLETADGVRTWLSVEEDPDLELVLYRDLPDAELGAGETVELDGVTFQLDEAGTARFAGEGTTGLDASGSVRYRDYTGPDGARLSLEDFGTGTWCASRGEVLARAEVRVFPAAG